MSSLGIFGLEFGNSFVMLKIRTLELISLQTFFKKIKSSKLGTKTPLFGIFRLKFKKVIVIYEISTLKFVKLRKFVKKQRFLNLWSEMIYFGAEIWEQYSNIWSQNPRICLVKKFCEKVKMPKFGTENV